MKRYLLVIGLLIISASAQGAPTISTPTVRPCDTSALISFNTSTASHSFVEYGTTTSYGSTTIDDTVRYYKENGVPVTGLTAGTLYHYRVVATDLSGTTTGTDQTFTTAANGTACKAQPIDVDVRMPDLTGAVEKTVKTSGGDYTPAQFQTALNDAAAATGVRIITVDAGVTLTASTAPSGFYTIGVKADNNWVIVRPSAFASLPAGKRVNSTDVASMFTIVNTTVDAPLQTVAGAHHWRFIGAEITLTSFQADAPGGVSQSGLVRWGTGAETLSSQLPHHLILDRCYVHGLTRKNDRRGVYVNAEDWGIIDSSLIMFQDAGQDAQAILVAMSKRGKILNNEVQATGECIMWGGVPLTIPSYAISDLTIARNYSDWRDDWRKNIPAYGGIDYVLKNLFELKTSKRLLMFGNVFANWWVEDQNYAVNFKLDKQSSVTDETMEDVTFYRNYLYHAGVGYAIQAAKDSTLQTAPYGKRFAFIQNLTELDGVTYNDTNTNANAVATAFGVFPTDFPDPQYIDYLEVDHNTFVNANPTPIGTTDGNLMVLGAPSATHKGVGLIFQNNVVGHRQFGVKADGTAIGTPALNAGFTGYTWTKQLMVGGTPGDYPECSACVASWAAVLFVNFNGGVAGDYRLTVSSPGHGTATDGSDIGVNVDAVQRATQYTITGDWLTDTPPAGNGGTVTRGSTVIRGSVRVN